MTHGNGLGLSSLNGVLLRPEYRGPLMGAAALGAFGAMVLLVLAIDAPLVLIGMLALAGGVTLFLRPELVLLYTNLPVLATHQGVPFLIASSFMLLLGIPLLHFVVARQEPMRFDAVLAVMLGLLAVMMISAFGAKGTDVALEYIQTYLLEGVVLYWLIVNTVRSRDSLRRVMLTVIAAGALLGLLTTVQEITGNYDQQFFGLASRNVEYLQLQQLDPTDPEVAEALRGFSSGRSTRANGPMDEPNRFAQILLVLLPLVLHAGRTASNRRCTSPARATARTSELT